MAAHAKCPHCGKNVRIDKGLLRPIGDPMERTWEADCPKCGGLISQKPTQNPQFVEINIENKEQYLKDNYPFSETPDLNDRFECLHCGETFTVKDYKVFRDRAGDEFICCPNAPECDGSVIDWIEPKEF